MQDINRSRKLLGAAFITFAGVLAMNDARDKSIILEEMLRRETTITKESYENIKKTADDYTSLSWYENLVIIASSTLGLYCLTRKDKK